jgi:hypothetical protein
MAKTEAEKRLSKLTDVGLVQRCEPIAGSLNFLLVRLLVKAALQDLTFELAPAVP